MFLYRLVNRLVFARSYLGKILLVSFLGVHIPIIGAVTYVLVSSEGGLMGNLDIVVAMLVATLAGTVATLIIHHGLLAPVRNAAEALDSYLTTQQVPTLPTKYPDEVGVLMANVQESITRLDAAMNALRTEKELDNRHFKAKLELLSGMSHELRTPLNHIVGFAEMMSNEVLGPLGGDTYKDYANTIGQSGVDLIETVKMLTEIGHAEAVGELDLEDIQLATAIRHGMATSHFYSERADVALKAVNVDPDVHVTVNARALTQALGHMFQAAIASTKAGGGVEVTAQIRRHGDGAQVLLTCPTGDWVLDDVPPELRSADLAAKAYSSANAPGQIASVSTIAVNLSLVSTLARLNGGALEVGHDPAGNRTIDMKLQLASGMTMAQAA